MFAFEFFIVSNKSILQDFASSNFEKNFRVIFKIIGIQFSNVNESEHVLPKTGSHPSLSRTPPQLTRARNEDNISPEITENNYEKKINKK